MLKLRRHFDTRTQLHPHALTALQQSFVRHGDIVFGLGLLQAFACFARPA